MRSKTRFSDHTESELIRSLEHRLSRCQCCCAADLWVVSQTKLVRLQISLGFRDGCCLTSQTIDSRWKPARVCLLTAKKTPISISIPRDMPRKGERWMKMNLLIETGWTAEQQSAKFPISSCCSYRASFEWNAATSLTIVCRTVVSLVALHRMNSSGALFQSEKLCCEQLCHLHGVGVTEITSALLFHKHAHSWQQFHEAILHLSAT